MLIIGRVEQGGPTERDGGVLLSCGELPCGAGITCVRVVVEVGGTKGGGTTKGDGEVELLSCGEACGGVGTRVNAKVG